MTKRKVSNLTKNFLGFKKNSPYFEEKMSKVATFKHSLFMEFVNSKQDSKKSTTHVGQSSINFNQTFRTK
jgi:hypothetical protein